MGMKTDLHLLGVIRVGVAGLDEFDGHLVEIIEVVGGVRDNVAFDTHESQILENCVLELSLGQHIIRDLSLLSVMSMHVPAP